MIAANEVVASSPQSILLRELLSPRELQEREICDESGAEIMRKL
jgi:hypothetical protein